MTSFRLSEPRYEAKRQELLRKYRSPSCNCFTFSKEFAVAFPELAMVAGFYFAPNGASHGEHWWLETQEGHVVDPTADQWPSCGTGHYEHYDPTKHLVPKGTCPCCGIGVYSRVGGYPCSQDCADSIAEEYQCKPSAGPFDADMDLACDQDIATKYGLPLPRPAHFPAHS